MRLATILSCLAVLLLIYNLRTAASLWDAPPRIIAPATVRAQTGRLQPLVSDSGLATAAAPIRTFEAPTVVADPSAGAPRVLAGKPPFEPRTPSVCGGSGRSGVPVTPRAINYLPASCEGPPAVCAALSAVAQASQQHDGAVLLLVAAHDDASELAPFVETAAAVGAAPRLLVAALDASASAAAKALSPAPTVLDAAPLLPAGLARPARKWYLAAALLAAGASVLYCDVRVRLSADPFGALYHDADLEAPPDPSASAGSMLFGGRWGRSPGERGSMMVAGDHLMGWSQMCESYAIGAVSPRLWFAAASHESVQLARRLSARLGGALFGDEGMVAGGMVWPAHEAEPYVLTEELVGPAHDGITRAGASLRVLEGRCFGGGKVVASLPSPSSSRGAATDDVLTARAFLARPQVLSSGCGATPLAPPEEAMGEAGASTTEKAPFEPWVRHEGLPTPRPLNWLPAAAAAGEAWPRQADCEAHALQPLCTTLRTVARRTAHGGEVLAAVSNKNLVGPGGALDLFLDGLNSANITHALVVALDEQTGTWLGRRGTAFYERRLVSRTGSTDNHATSGLKFKVLMDFLSVGCSVLLSDVDVIWLTDPFLGSLYRDSDVEGMSDGWDELTAYGHHHGSGAYRVHARNSGMFFLQSTVQGLAMVTRLARRMETEGVWDQSAWNQEQFHPSLGAMTAVGVSARVMNYLCFENSKLYFRFLRHDAQLRQGFRPVSMHVNYHPEKQPRMRDLYNYYVLGSEGSPQDLTGIWKWNGGEGSALNTECRAINTKATPDASNAIVKRLLGPAGAGSKLDWGGCAHCVELAPDGALKTPWGSGRWGATSTIHFPDVAFAAFFNTVHLLRIAPNGSFVSTRCSDGEGLRGALVSAT